MRGMQITDSEGVAIIDTIFPGWYRGRTIHFHVKVHIGGTVTDSGNLFFPSFAVSFVFVFVLLFLFRLIERSSPPSYSSY